MYKEKKNKQQERLQEQKYVLAIEEMLKQLLLYTLGWHFLQGKTWTWLSLWRAWTAMCGKGPQPGRSWSLPARQQRGNTEIHCPMSFFIGLSGYILNKQQQKKGWEKKGWAMNTSSLHHGHTSTPRSCKLIRYQRAARGPCLCGLPMTWLNIPAMQRP